MKIRHSKDPLPKLFNDLPGADKALGIWDIGLTPDARLRMKLLLFRNNREMSAFWKPVMGGIPGKQCLGIVQSPGFTVYNYESGTEKRLLEVDPTYFAVMALLEKHLTVEIICHEAMHAAFAYSNRSKKQWPGSKDHPEENVCYPAGLLAARIDYALRKDGFLP